MVHVQRPAPAVEHEHVQRVDLMHGRDTQLRGARCALHDMHHSCVHHTARSLHPNWLQSRRQLGE